MILLFSSKHVHADAQPTLSPFSHLHTYTSNIQHTHSVLSFHPSLIQHPHPLTRHTRFPNLLIGWWQRAVGLEPYICSLQTNLSLEQKPYSRLSPDSTRHLKVYWVYAPLQLSFWWQRWDQQSFYKVSGQAFVQVYRTPSNGL